jgi:hypothetical protein
MAQKDTRAAGNTTLSTVLDAHVYN